MLKNSFSKSILTLVSIALTGCSTAGKINFVDNISAVNALNASSSYNLDSGILTGADCNTHTDVKFEADESLFAFISWVNFVAELEDFERNMPRHKIHNELLGHLANIKKANPEMYRRHKQAYQAFLPKSSLYVKNGLLVSSSKFYGKAPEFRFYPPKENEFEKEYDLYLANQAIPSEIIKEFYQKANIGLFWKKALNIYKKEISKYENNARIVLKDFLCYTNTKQQIPVTFKLSLIGYFGISGQTRYSSHENRFIIQINPEPETPEYFEYDGYNSMLKVFRHEFSHSLFNIPVAKANEQYNFSKKLEEVAKAVNVEDAMTSPEELMARSMEHLDYALHENSAENTFYMLKNLGFSHLSEQLQAFRQSNKPFISFIPHLFAAYNPDKEIKRWRKKEAKEKGLVSANSLRKKINNKDLMRVHLGH